MKFKNDETMSEVIERIKQEVLTDEDFDFLDKEQVRRVSILIGEKIGERKGIKIGETVVVDWGLAKRLGDLARTQGSCAEAIAWYEEAAGLLPALGSEASYRAASCYEEAGDVELAMAWYRAIEQPPWRVRVTARSRRAAVATPPLSWKQ